MQFITSLFLYFLINYKFINVKNILFYKPQFNLSLKDKALEI